MIVSMMNLQSSHGNPRLTARVGMSAVTPPTAEVASPRTLVSPPTAVDATEAAPEVAVSRAPEAPEVAVSRAPEAPEAAESVAEEALEAAESVAADEDIIDPEVVDSAEVVAAPAAVVELPLEVELAEKSSLSPVR
jgi:hypothetical protein